MLATFNRRRYFRLTLFILCIYLLALYTNFTSSHIFLNTSSYEFSPFPSYHSQHSQHTQHSLKYSSSHFAENAFITGPIPTSIIDIIAFVNRNPWLDSWISHGKLPYDTDTQVTPIPALRHSKFDVIYPWVNGSETYFADFRQAFFDQTLSRVKELFGDHFGKLLTRGSQGNRFRDFDELRFSIRSIERFFKDTFRKVIVLTSNLPSYNPDGTPNSQGQIPHWFNASWVDQEKNSESHIKIIHHTDFFSELKSLPTFNSIAIESQLYNLNSVVEGHFLYMNDDTFLGRTITPLDLWTPLYGFVIRPQSELRARIIPDDEDDKMFNLLTIGPTEWEGIQYANYLLSKRFGKRERVYVSHLPRAMSVHILKEITDTWPEEISETASHRFRSQGRDMSIPFMFSHYVMERHREALLRSFLLFKIDNNGDGYYNSKERKQLIIDAGLFKNEIISTERTTIKNVEKNLRKSNLWMNNSQTEYHWSSHDGFAFMKVNNNGNTVFSHKFPLELRKCQFDIDYCLGEGFKNEDDNQLWKWNSSEIFKRVAFDDVSCGDCLISALMRNSPSGLEIFLPLSNLESKSDIKLKHKWSYIWSDQTYSRLSNLDDDILRNLLGYQVKDYQFLQIPDKLHLERIFLDRNDLLRSIALYTIQRYSYIHGETPSYFALLSNPFQAAQILGKEILPKKPALFCINDDLKSENPKVEESMADILKDFFQAYFPNSSAYELY